MQMKSDLDHAALFFYKKNRETNIFFSARGDIWMIFSWMHSCIRHYLGLDS